ncbi:OmpA family protein [Cruoricaptor ignavus]|uniref:OmpA family protein n=1 Tax=Cruoricaptor ignavus TaxID=1118202 RepID=A0A7M1T4G7_9FLAO|nr:OmpA family protein [Cruoricaptor ignavus]QOR74699.1 OmpA family protein [Cruoricaptor ignavus]
MKKNLATLFLAGIPAVVLAQTTDTLSVNRNYYPNNGEYPNTYTSGSTQIAPQRETKRFNDWAISIGGGVPLVQSADLTSLKNGNGKNLVGYSAYFSVDKALTHAVGINLQYDRGETRQGFFNTKNRDASPAEPFGARTQYDAISLLGDVNFSNLLRRVDNKSPYRFALHGYAGAGTLAYRAYLEDQNGQRKTWEVKPFKGTSLFGQAGAGLKYKLGKAADLELRAMYVITGDDEFDGGGEQYSAVNMREDNTSDNFFNVTLGVSFKLGKHESHVMWHDPLQEVYYKLDVLANQTQDVEVCKKGDADNDGVCDDWDRQLDTPAGARVDGAGVALDTDLDGVIDLYDKCVTVPGPAENQGCPTGVTMGVVGDQTRSLEGIEFDFDSDRILPSNQPILNNAVNYINSSGSNYNVVGGTDTRGSDAYNQKLSERRANNVKNYLIQNGVSGSKLKAIGRGEKDLKYPECNPATKCPEWKNRANRRVYFEAR